MRKALKFIVPGICIIVVIITFYMIFKMQNKIDEGILVSNNSDNFSENIIEENVLFNENIVENNNTIIENEDEDIIDEEEDKFSNTKQEKAIDLVKEYWGEDSTVYFTNEGINSNGEYIVAVRQKTSTTVEEYFKVNIETNEIEIDY